MTSSSPPPQEHADGNGDVDGIGNGDGNRNGNALAPLSGSATRPAPPLAIEVFTGPESAFFATSSLIIGARDAILVDAQLTRSAGRELAEWIAGKGRNLLAVVITHPHPDHYFGVEEVLRLFPQAHVLAAPPVVDAIAATAAAKVRQWRPVYGDDIPENPILPRPLRPQPLMIDRQLIRVLYLGQGDCDTSTVVHVPGTRTVIAGDLAYNGTHIWTADTTAEQRTAWIRNLGRIAELGAQWVIAGHRAPEQGDEAARVLSFTGEYLQDYDRLLAEHPGDPEGLITAVGELYGELTLPPVLAAAAAAHTRVGADEDAVAPADEDPADTA
ncbi:MBL fold metallo-hydrolase [Kitasatospora kifunensis]|uniref:Glyoxylase-like metal-dependent hydrolase (Beta-lactamase superfamily II) n=1 Tax=Kitasatospora kifunensis TaxID=58351 RepID=A0A7W7R309_KITKI|nr:MBL fold metallo-hydrolase [Kitasatospora kifunensis]MBB4924502.1 glyoxylase-like metal-dependent hydrolase (beta-lactamase superfamily II) [Kitasatospora kifunensis]